MSGDADLFGNPVKPQRRDGKCSHLNITYTLPVGGWVRIRSEYAPGTDTVEEVDRHVSWNGQINGVCEDCGKGVYHGANTPLYIQRRLNRLSGTFTHRLYPHEKEQIPYEQLGRLADEGKPHG